VAPLLAAALAAPATGQVTQRVSLTSLGAQANGASFGCSISPDGRYVAFDSAASSLVSGDTNAKSDVFVRDRLSGTTERVSLTSLGAQGNGNSFRPAISADGRYVAFDSEASNLVSGDTNTTTDIFVRDRQSGTTERVSVDSLGAQGIGYSPYASISADGRYVAFDSDASSLVSGDTNVATDVFVRDRQSGTTELPAPSRFRTRWEKFAELLPQTRQVFLRDAPDDFRIHVGVGIDEHIPEGHGAPKLGDQTSGVRIQLGELRQSFTGDLELPLYS